MPPTRRIRKSITLRKEASTLGTLASLVLGVPAVAAMLLLNGDGAAGGEGGEGSGGAASGGAASGGGQGAATAAAGGGAASGGASGGSEDDTPLGPQGEKALEEFKRRAREAEAANRTKDEELQKLRDEKKTAEERALDQARLEGKQLAETETQPRLTALELENAILRHVGAKFADPDDAVMNLSSETMRTEVLDDGKVDVEKLTKAADALLAKKPHLAAGATPAAAGAARPHQGANGNGSGAQADADFIERMKGAVEHATGVK